MKKFIIASFLMLAALSAYGQTYVRNGKEYSSVSKTRSSSEGRKTGYTWKDSKGNVYDIYISERGSCYIIRTSSKTGKQYKSYLSKEISAEIAKELGVKK